MNNLEHKPRKFMKQTIFYCERAKGEHSGNWVVQSYHPPTGMPYADELCPHYSTLEEAKDHIRMAQ